MWIFFELRREGVEPAGDAIIEARADGIDHQVAIMHRVIGLECAMHAEHAEPAPCRTPDRRRGPSSVDVIGNPVVRDKLTQQRRGACGPELMTPPPV